MKKQQLSAEQKRLETDLWIIALVTLGVFLFYAATGKQLMSFVANSNILVLCQEKVQIKCNQFPIFCNC